MNGASDTPARRKPSLGDPAAILSTMKDTSMKPVTILFLLATTWALSGCGTGAPAGAVIGSTVDATVAGAIVGAAIVN
jgi:hypothetical protein